ncbi:hypothetical protein K502DRAFT_365003 [Neoconidiobolus thromboides FSU 785]|nr:hypothetical protein K502DRAFT_365003 [Neoconidiobolus thromboides FSU 785]
MEKEEIKTIDEKDILKKAEENSTKKSSHTIKSYKNTANPYANINVKSLFKIPKKASELVQYKRIRWSLSSKELEQIAYNCQKLIESEQGKIRQFTRLLILLNNDNWQHQSKLLPRSAVSILPSNSELSTTDRTAKNKSDLNLDSKTGEYQSGEKMMMDHPFVTKETHSLINLNSSPEIMPSSQLNTRTFEEDVNSEDNIHHFDMEHEEEHGNNKLTDGLNNTVNINQDQNLDNNQQSLQPFLLAINEKLITMVQESLDNSNHYVSFLSNTYHALIKQNKTNNDLFNKLTEISKLESNNKD